MYRIFDSHAHIYPEKIALKAAESIGNFYSVSARFGGTPDELIRVGDRAGVEKFLVHSVATTAKQVPSINNYIIGECAKHPDRFIGFGAMHPDFENPYEELKRAKDAGLKGIKLHPDFQDFAISDPRMDEAYEAAGELSLPLLFHTGDARFERSHPKHIPVILKKHPKLRIICAHFGGWSQWEDAERCLESGSVWVDTCSSMFILTPEYTKKLISHYGSERVLFGSDYPMWDVADEIKHMENLKLTHRESEMIFSENLINLLEIQ